MGVLEVLGWEWTNDPDDTFDFAIAWNRYAKKWTGPGRRENEILAGIYNRGIPVFNYHVTGTNKRRVEETHQQAFGYGAFLDPCSHHGPAIEKSDRNSMHDGREITCPIPPETIRPDKVYMRAIDTRTHDGNYRDMRTVINNCRPSGVSIFYKYPHERFSGASSAYDLEYGPPEIAYSPEEMDKITRFCKLYGLDFCEMDVLRDNHDGCIYIVDANPSGGGYKILYDPSLKAYKYLNDSNRKKFLERQGYYRHKFYELPFKQMVLDRLDSIDS